ncbi:hypothetical protein C6500_03715 [Candidatus Poribacteria bacterium]|nr:MAG: hypothetical protein C6500_03715 [Candidatus Poribacteria bacterium]
MNIQKLIFLLLLVAIITIVGCVPGDGNHTADEPAGFFWGVWHGLIAPISLIWGLFNSEIRLYEPQNTGWAYDLGFYLAVIGGFSSFSSSSSSKGRKKSETQENRGAE